MSARHPRGLRMLHLVAATSLFAAACSSPSNDASPEGGTSEGGTAPATTAPPTTASPTTAPPTTAPPTTAPPTTLPPIDLGLEPEFEQLTVFDGSLGTEVVVVDEQGTEVGRAPFADNGTALVRGLTAGMVEVLVAEDSEPIASAGLATIPTTDPPPASHYQDQELAAGFNYLTTRDGTTLSALVSLPGVASDGPYPTLVEYSGYSPSDPMADDPGRFLITSLGYALVQVNVRGTGCSGGSFDAFEPIQDLDGYDVIETVAAQPWAAKVAMYGISYPGIMQLHVAATNPPSLAAIAPLSVIDSVESVLYPGGIYNNGFGENWSERVTTRAEAFGQPWTRQRVQAGDTICEDNQELRVHNPDLVATIRSSPFRTPFSESRSPQVETIDVPVFLAGAWQDEQTGGRFPAMINRFEAAPLVRAHLYNGLHIDPLGPLTLSSLVEFYNLYVGDSTEGLDVVTRLLVGAGLSAVFGEPVAVPDLPTRTGTLAEVRSQYEAEPSIRVFFEHGATASNLPVTRFDTSFQAWPPAEIEAQRLYLTEAGRMRGTGPSGPGVRSFETRPNEGGEVTIGDLSTIWTNSPDWSWEASPESASFTSDRFETESVFVGPASADLYVSADANDADLEVTLSEVDASGNETYIQSGWLRLSRRALGSEATELRPAPSFLEADVALLEKDEIVLARVEILPFAHVIRPGSRLRITVDTPGGSRPQWTFAVLDAETNGETRVTIHTGGDTPSSILLPLVPSVNAPDRPVPCGRLRGQPCRS